MQAYVNQPLGELFMQAWCGIISTPLSKVIWNLDRFILFRQRCFTLDPSSWGRIDFDASLLKAWLQGFYLVLSSSSLDSNLNLASLMDSAAGCPSKISFSEDPCITIPFLGSPTDALLMGDYAVLLFDASFMRLPVIRVWIIAAISWQIWQLLAARADVEAVENPRLPSTARLDRYPLLCTPPFPGSVAHPPFPNALRCPFFSSCSPIKEKWSLYLFCLKLLSRWRMEAVTGALIASCSLSISSLPSPTLSHWSWGLGLIKQFERVTFLTQAPSFKGYSANN